MTMTTTIPRVYEDDRAMIDSVDPFYADYLARRQQLEAAGQYPYNDDFRGHFTTTPVPDDMPNPNRPRVMMTEDTVIYYCQVRHRVEEMQAKVDAKLAEGYVVIDNLPQTEKFRGVALYPTRNMGGEYAHYEDARLVIEIDGRIKGVLPKGKRTQGHRVDGRVVLVLR